MARVREICLALPEATEKSFGGHTSPAFRVRDKMFVMIGEDRTAMTFKAAAGVQEALVGDDPERFYVPPYVGSKGWVGTRLDVDQDWDEIAELLVDSYRLIAPKRLAALADVPRRLAAWPTAREHTDLKLGKLRAQLDYLHEQNESLQKARIPHGHLPRLLRFSRHDHERRARVAAGSAAAGAPRVVIDFEWLL